MITQEQIDNLKAGDKLIFYRDGGVLSAKKSNVFTFANWSNRYTARKCYWQCKELLNQGNHVHNFSIYDTELFDENIHTEYVLMDEKKLVAKRREFIETYM